MKRMLFTLAIVLDLLVLGAWFATGAHLGWTRTSVTTMRTDPVTELQYPETRRQLVVGLELLLIGLALSGGLMAASALMKRQTHP